MWRYIIMQLYVGIAAGRDGQFPVGKTLVRGQWVLCVVGWSVTATMLAEWWSNWCCQRRGTATRSYRLMSALIYHVPVSLRKLYQCLTSVALCQNPSQSYGASPAIWDHAVTFHTTQVNASRLHLSRTGRYSIYLPRRDGKLSWPWWLVIYPSKQ